MDLLNFRLFQTLKTNRIYNKTDNYTEIEELIQLMLKTKGKHILARLYQAHILLLQESYNEAKWILTHVEQIDRKSVV